MSTDQPHFPATTRLILFWRKIQACYRYANILSHHVLGALLKTLLAAYFIFSVMFLVLRYAVLPNISHYKSDVEQVVSHAIGQPVSIGTLQASWDGFRPRLQLADVKIKDNFGRDALTLPKVSATISWFSVTGTPRLRYLEIDRPDLDVRRDIDGKLYVAGILVPTEEKSNGKGADWVLLQKEIVIRDGRVRWNDNQRGAPELLLNDVNLVLHNHWRHHEFTFKATPPAALASPVDLRAAFDHPFAHRSSDATRWKGELYFELANADFAAWKTYIPYPLEVQQGHGSARAWLDFDRAKIADFTADLNVADTVVRLQKNLPVLALDQLSGRVLVQEDIDPHSEDGTPTLGLNGHTVTLSNFSMRTNDGLVLPPTTISESFEPAKNGQAPKTGLTATLLDLQTLANVAERLPLSADQLQMLTSFAPRGQLRNFSARWQGYLPAVSTFDFKGQFVGLSLNAQAARPARPRIDKLPALAATPFVPGIDNLTGYVEMNDHGGIVKLDSNKLQIDLPGIFNDPEVLFDKLTMQATWVFQEKDKLLVQINNMDFVQDGLIGSVSGTDIVSLNQQRNKSSGLVDFTGHIADFDVKKLDHYLPTQTNPQFRSWITGALVSGSARDVVVKVKGDLKDFPFHTDTATEKPKGEFTVVGKIVDGVLSYDPRPNPKNAKEPIWPLLEDIQGIIAFDRTRMEIDAERARTHGVVFSTVKAILPDFASPKNDVLDIAGTATGPLGEFVGYTRDSPVQDMIGGFTNDTKANGNAKLALKLQLPLNHMIDSKVQGKLQFENDDVNLLLGLPQLSATTGVLEFSEKGLNLNAIHANFLGGQVVLSGGGPADASLIKAEGTLTADGLRKFAPASSQRLVQRITGSTRFDVGINVKKGRADIVVGSTLQGLGIDLPAPLHKEGSEVLPTRFEMIGISPTDASIAREEIKLTVGTAIAARYEREKSAERNAAWRMVRGGIGVNAPPSEPGNGVLLNVNMKSLNVDAWLDLSASLSSADKSNENGNAADALGFSEFISPQSLAARATEMVIFKRKLDNVVLGATLEKDVWQANIDSAQASGYVTYSAKADQGKGRATARLSSLTIPKEVASQVTELLDGKTATSDLPALDIVADNFDLLGQQLGQLRLEANNVHRLNSNEWQIKNLSVSNSDAELKVLNGIWASKDGENRTSLTYSLEVFDAGRLLTRLGFPGLLSGGKGKMDGDVTWNGAPYAIDYSSLSGKLRLDMTKGQFLKEGPGAAKLLGVLSLQSLPRRLTLDFRDVFSEGFAFDGVTMDAAISKGVFSTDNLKMHGIDATVVLDGSADINKETENLHVVVIPELDAGAASVVYGLAVNPVIGLGSFLAQLFLKAPLTKAFTHEYQIKGPWKEPIVTKLERKNEVGTRSAASNANTASAK